MKKMMDLRFAWVVGLIGFIQPALGQSEPRSLGHGTGTLFLPLQPTQRIEIGCIGCGGIPAGVGEAGNAFRPAPVNLSGLDFGYPREEQSKFMSSAAFPTG